MFITFEGVDFSGKSSVAEKLASSINYNTKYKAFYTAEPTSTLMGRTFRRIIDEKENLSSGDILLLLADRANHIENEIIPMLKRDIIVICDRFIDSTEVYQKRMCGIKVPDLFEIYPELNIKPDITYYLKVSINQYRSRVSKIKRKKTDFEKRNIKWQYKLIEEFNKLAKEIDRIKTINTEGKNIDTIVAEVFNDLFEIKDKENLEL